jgi:hypothetical protein
LEKEEVELLPAGLISCLLDNREVRILKISPQKLTVRVSEEIENIDSIRVMFYIFNENKYEEVKIGSHVIIEKTKFEFYLSYTFAIDSQEYSYNVRNSFRNYSKYIMSKTFGEDSEFSKEMVGYPAEKDAEFYKYYLEQKEEWLSNLNYLEWDNTILNSIEFAIALDNDTLYKKYMHKDIKAFTKEYLKENFINTHKLFQMEVTRLYIGNEFCHNLFPEVELLKKLLNKAYRENLHITLCFTYLRDCHIEKTKDIIEKVYAWCKDKSEKIEIIINDFGMLKLVEEKLDFFRLSLGVLLNKRKKDPRYIYKKGYAENKELIAKNNLNSELFDEFLKSCNIKRYEYENCGYRMSIAEGKHSIHIPFYQTNTSQYCPLYAKCTTMDRGKQKLITSCEKYCKDYIFAYPKHLNMVGRYNSLFAFDETLLKNPKELEYYINRGIDRIVLNFI